MAIIASNFKTNHTRKSTASFVNEVNDYLVKNSLKNEVYVFPTSTSLDSFDTVSNFNIGVQNAYSVNSGSFTGEIGTIQLDEFGIKTILIGHSERRQIFKESDTLIAEKVKASIKNIYHLSHKKIMVLIMKIVMIIEKLVMLTNLMQV